jgi:DNA invertase Pin-like site-specific DNA recombinase
MRRKITTETWEQFKTAYAAGVGLREIARKMNIPEGTVLAHAKRQGWTQPQLQPALLRLSAMISQFFTGVRDFCLPVLSKY